jgi:NAD+ synthase (glutamine-hydrolysing)
MYALNAGVPRTIIPYLLRHLAQMPVFNFLTSLILDVVEKAETPVQPAGDAETGMTQKAEDLVGPYELHDFFLFFHLRLGFRPAKIFMLACHAFNGKYDESTIKQWLQTFCRRFFNQQFLRSSMPDSPKVGSVCLSPRGDWRMATDASSALWLKECEAL